MVKTSRVFIRDCSMVSVYPLILFGGGRVNVQLQKGVFVISLDDGWIHFGAASQQVSKRATRHIIHARKIVGRGKKWRLIRQP